MNKAFVFFLILFSSAVFGQEIIPKPLSFQKGEGRFELTPQTTIVVAEENQNLRAIAVSLQKSVMTTVGLPMKIEKEGKENVFVFSLNSDLAEEAYAVQVSKEKVILSAGSEKGFFYAYQTLLQLFDARIYSDFLIKDLQLSLPVCLIKDEPRFGYRGMMLDVGRHMMPVSFIKKYIDLLAMYKFNQFHWHLTEDQGWRIEIKKYPKLTEIGAYRKETPLGHDSENKGDGKPYGGFYTQEEVKEIVAYASSKYINVIPEIEMPGHAVAALASYPEFGCTGGPYEVRTRWGVAEDVYCPYDKTFEFLEDVLTEVMDLFPSEYIHIGGDECPKDSWEASEFCQDLIKAEGLKDEHELQSYFITRIDKFITSKGRKLIGWDEILEGGLSPNATVMSWRGTQGGIEAARQKHDVIMSPNSFHYLDYYQGDPATEPLAIGGFLPLDKVYSYEPLAEELTEDEKKYILGVQANLWTEYIPTPEKVEYMLFPRALAVAETGWSAEGSKDYKEFENRVKAHFERLKVLKVNYAESIYNIKSDIRTTSEGMLKVYLSNIEADPIIRYTLDGTEPNVGSALYEAEKGIDITQKTRVRAVLFDKEGKSYANQFMTELRVNKATGKPYVYRSAKTRYTGGTDYALTDGKVGTEKDMQAWVGLNEGKLDLTLDLQNKIKVTDLSIGFLHAVDSWIMFPANLKVSTSNNGTKFKEISRQDFNKGELRGKLVERVKVDLKGKKVRYIKIEADRYGKLPDWHAGAGSNAWLFVDEIDVN